MCWIDPQVFKANDIRGTYPDQLDERFAYALGRALSGVFRARRVAIGHDARTSSPPLYAALAAGLRDSDVEVGCLGMCASELLYYVLGRSEEFDLGAVVTASHNPPQFNGFKLCRSGAEPVTMRNGLDRAMAAMDRSVAVPDERFDAPPRSVFAERDYVDFALATAGGPAPRENLKVVVDAGNGVGGLLWKRLAEATGVAPIEMNFRPDGTFPAHLPDTSQLENLRQLQQKVIEERADLGLAYDGDADRVVAVLPDGHLMDGSETGAALALRALERQPEGQLGLSMVSSRKVIDFLTARGRRPLLVPVGHAKIKHTMRGRPDLPFVAEASGHYYYRSFFCCDSALVTTLHLLQMTSDGTLLSVVRGLPGPWHALSPEPSYAFEGNEDARSACIRVAEGTLKQFPNPDEIICEKNWQVLRNCQAHDIPGSEGVRVDYPTWWFCVRPSATESRARLSVEANRLEDLREKAGILCSLFESQCPPKAI